MANGKTTTRWAVVSLAFSVLGCLAGLALLALAERYGTIANRTAGVGVIYMVGHMTLAATLCLLGILSGVVALFRTFGGTRGGWRMAWAGVALGCLPLAFALVSFLLSDADSNPLRR